MAINYRPLARVRSHVDFELRTLGEAVTARFAPKWLFVRVGSQVLEEMTLEGTLTDRTLERFHAAVVAAQMFAQAVRAGKRLAADWARVVPFSGVSSQMHLAKTTNESMLQPVIDCCIYLEVGGTGEPLVALVALVGPLSCVRPLVLEELAAASKLFPTMIASVLGK